MGQVSECSNTDFAHVHLGRGKPTYWPSAKANGCSIKKFKRNKTKVSFSLGKTDNKQPEFYKQLKNLNGGLVGRLRVRNYKPMWLAGCVPFEPRCRCCGQTLLSAPKPHLTYRFFSNRSSFSFVNSYPK